MPKYSKILILVCLFSFFPIASIRAEIVADNRVSDKEKAVFAFFRLGGRAPDYEKWVKEGGKYQNYSEEKQEEFLVQDMLRLGSGFGDFDPEKDHLVIRTKVEIFQTGPDKDKDHKPYFYFQFPGEDKGHIPVFPYPYGKDIISLMINNLAIFSKIPLSDSQYKRVKQYAPYEKESVEGQLVIHVRPTQADHTKMHLKDGINQWLMAGEIGYIQCLVENFETGKKDELWNYVAPWYKAEMEARKQPSDLDYPSPFDLKK